jgi:hypothetical protein
MLLPFAIVIFCLLITCILIIVALVYLVLVLRDSWSIREAFIIGLFLEPGNTLAILIQERFLVRHVTSVILLRNSFHNDSEEPVRRRMHFLAVSAALQTVLAFIMVVVGVWMLNVVGLVCEKWRRSREQRQRRHREEASQLRLRT